jgi:hypothetical protein
MQPLPHFINSTHFTVQRSRVFCNCNDYNIFLTLANAKSKLPEDSAEALKHVGAFVI